MARYFVPISIEKLREKIESEITNLCDLSQFKKDLKVKFDCENITTTGEFGPKKLGGYHTLENGLTFLGVCAGGDWEIPCFFIIYFEGKKLRAYIPTDGNLWNTDTKMAYGNNAEWAAQMGWDFDEEDIKNNIDVKNIKKRYSIDVKENEDIFDVIPCHDVNAIIADIKNRIKLKVLNNRKI
jgi:hypothetical protein